MMSDKFLKKCIRLLGVLAFWLAVWQLAAVTVNFPLLLPAPLSVGKTLLQMASEVTFWKSVFLSLARVFAGMALGCILGCVLALLTWRCTWADILISPAIRVIRATPVVSIILLIYLWVTRTNIPSVISTLMVLPVIWDSIRTGLESTDVRLLEMAGAYRFGWFKRLRLIWLPSLRPSLNSGLSTGLGLAWKSGIAAEVICPPRYAIGTELSQAKTALQSPELYAWTVVIIILSQMLDCVLRFLLRYRKRHSGKEHMFCLINDRQEENSGDIRKQEKTDRDFY
ncbi:MAG: ABC transporter permease subunit [Lachnospiraceae bacterium]|nr:ABC transporter permease subunit [Lachnospiraceae bacterium]